MRHLRGLARALPVASAFLFAACGSETGPAVVAPPSAIQQLASSSGTVRGLVVDPANRPVPNARVECTSDADCVQYGELSAEHHDRDSMATTNAQGSYRLTVAPTAEGGFLLTASARGYSPAWQTVELPDPGCTWDQPRCSVTVNFTLTPIAD